MKPRDKRRKLERKRERKRERATPAVDAFLSRMFPFAGWEFRVSSYGDKRGKTSLYRPFGTHPDGLRGTHKPLTLLERLKLMAEEPLPPRELPLPLAEEGGIGTEVCSGCGEILDFPAIKVDLENPKDLVLCPCNTMTEIGTGRLVGAFNEKGHKARLISRNVVPRGYQGAQDWVAAEITTLKNWMGRK